METLHSPTVICLGGIKFVVEESGMNSRHFANCETGHILVKEFKVDDFFCWFDERQHMIVPFLPICIRSDELTPVLTSGQGNWK